MRLRVQRRIFASVLVAGLIVTTPALGGDVIRDRLSSGVTVLMMPGEWNRIVAVSAMVDAGSKHDPGKLKGLAHLTNRMLTQGTTTLSAAELAELVDGSGIQLGSEVTEDYSQVYVTAIDSQLDLALEVLADVLQNPSFDSTRLLDEQRIAHELLDSRQRDPLYAAIGQVSELLFGKHPYAVPVVGTAKSIDRITSKQLVDFHSKRYVSGNTVISVVGNFSPDHIIDRMDELFTDYPQGVGPADAFKAIEPPAEDPVKVVYRDTENASVVVGFQVPPSNHSDYPAIRVVNAILGDGTGTRLPLLLGPTGEDLADASGAFCHCRAEGSALILYAMTHEPDKVLELVGSEIDRLASEPVSDIELETAKNRIAGAHMIRGQTNIVRAGRLALYELNDLGLDFGESFLSAVNRVDKDDIVGVASRWLKKPVTVIVRPGRSATPPERKKPTRAGI